MESEAFKDNFLKVLEHNEEADNLGYRVAINKFSSMTKEEYHRKLGVKSTYKSNTTLESQDNELEKHGINLKVQRTYLTDNRKIFIFYNLLIL